MTTKNRTIFMAIFIMFAFVLAPFISESTAEGRILTPGKYEVGDDITPGWYRLRHTEGKYSSVYIYTYKAASFDSTLSSWFCYYGEYEGDRIMADAILLVNGNLVVVGDMNDGEPDTSTSDVQFELLQEYQYKSSIPNTAVSFTVAAGRYICGLDFPPGAYSIDVSPDAHYSFINYDIYDENGKRVFGGVIHQNDGGGFGKIEFEDGWVWEAEEGPACFKPYTGIVFE